MTTYRCTTHNKNKQNERKYRSNFNENYNKILNSYNQLNNQNSTIKNHQIFNKTNKILLINTKYIDNLTNLLQKFNLLQRNIRILNQNNCNHDIQIDRFMDQKDDYCKICGFTQHHPLE